MHGTEQILQETSKLFILLLFSFFKLKKIIYLLYLTVSGPSSVRDIFKSRGHVMWFVGLWDLSSLTRDQT